MTDKDLLNGLSHAVHLLRKCYRVEQPLLFAARVLNVQEAAARLEQPEPSGEDAFDEWGAQVDKQLADLTNGFKNYTAVVREHYSQLSELKQKHDLRLKHLGNAIGSHEDALGAAEKQLAELTERLDRTLRSLAVKQPLPKPSGKDEEVANLTQKIDDSHNELADRDQILRDKIPELTERVDALQPVLDAFAGRLDTCEQTLETLGDAIIGDGFEQGPLPKSEPVCNNERESFAVCTRCEGTGIVCRQEEPACEHPKGARLRCENLETHRELVLCTRCCARRYLSDIAWITPQPSSETDDGEGKTAQKRDTKVP